ncbi:MAG TPA: hypothetical protein PK514_03155 [Spirochaetota bacterium]|nr:hypothetical protein [Spirochaetota bacterium]
MKLLELVKKLFGIRQPAPAVLSPDAVLADIIKDSFSLNLKFVTGDDMNTAVTKVKHELFEKFLNSGATGYISSTYGAEETPCSQFFIPGEFVRYLYSQMKSVHSDIPADQCSALNLLIEWAEGSLYHMFLPRQGDSGEHLRVKRELQPSDAQAVMWGVSDCVVFQVRAAEFTAYLAVPQFVWSGLSAGVKDKDFAWRLRSIAVTEYTGGADTAVEEVPVSIDITRPKEFVLGRLFLPALLKVEGTVVSSAFKKISAGTDMPASGCFKVSLDIKVDEEIYRLWYCFEGYSLNTFNEKFVTFDGLFKPILREILSSLKTACPELKVAGIRYNASPAPEPVTSAVILHSELKINFTPVSTLVAVPARFLNLIALNILSPWEVNLLQSSSRNRLLSVLSVNSAFFSRGIGSFLNSYRGGGKNIPAIFSCMPFYEFMELVSDSDLKIIAQNFILPVFASTYMCLFRIGVADHSSPGTESSKLYTVDSDWNRINKFLPRNVLEDAEANIQWTGADHFDALNRQTMMDLFKAADSGRLLLSSRAMFILRNQFYDAIQAGYRKELEQLKQSGEPFVSLDGLPYNIRQLAVTRVSDRDLCLVMLDAGDRMQAIMPLLSRTRKAKIIDDTEVLKMKYMENKITAGDRVNAIHAVMESLEKEKGRK